MADGHGVERVTAGNLFRRRRCRHCRTRPSGSRLQTAARAPLSSGPPRYEMEPWLSRPPGKTRLDRDQAIDRRPFPGAALWERAARSTGKFSNSTSRENYSGINMPSWQYAMLRIPRRTSRRRIAKDRHLGRPQLPAKISTGLLEAAHCLTTLITSLQVALHSITLSRACNNGGNISPTPLLHNRRRARGNTNRV